MDLDSFVFLEQLLTALGSQGDLEQFRVLSKKALTVSVTVLPSTGSIAATASFLSDWTILCHTGRS